jgi:hypothetical protein
MSLSEPQTTAMGAHRALTGDVVTGDVFVPVTPDVANEFRKNPRTIKRWITDPELGFPTPIRINGRLFISRRLLEDWKRERIAASITRTQA